MFNNYSPSGVMRRIDSQRAERGALVQVVGYLSSHVLQA